MEKYLEHGDQVLASYRIPYYPNVTMGWDSSPRTIQSESWFPVTGFPIMNILGGNIPENFRLALEKTRDKLTALDGPSILNINCWNEWTEGTYLEPDQESGMAYLEAVKSVFGKA
jgi:hypothetical protein